MRDVAWRRAAGGRVTWRRGVASGGVRRAEARPPPGSPPVLTRGREGGFAERCTRSLGAHILSGAVLEPHALNELLPNWKSLNVRFPALPFVSRFCGDADSATAVQGAREACGHAAYSRPSAPK